VGKDATVDWRDVLVAAGMANGDWREVLAGQGFAVPDCHERDPPSIPERAVARGPHRRQRRGTAAPRSEPRAATRLDAPAILSINRDGVPGVSPLAPSDVERFLAISPFFRVVERASIVGYLIGIGSDADYDGEEFLWFRGRFADFVYVDQVAVARDARGTGVATLLYADLERFAIARRSPRLALEVNLRPENRPSLAFHDRLGFAEIGRLETADGRLVSLRSKSPGPPV
jgi:predicted GNAT superfamily acetyltransferase